MARSTPATVTLEKAGVFFKLHEYNYDPGAERIGMQAAEALGVSPGAVAQDADGEGRRHGGLRPDCQ